MQLPQLLRYARRRNALAVLVLTLFGLVGLAAPPASADTSPTAAPSAPQRLTAEPLSPTSISVDWQSTTGAETSTNGFVVAVRRLYPTPTEPIGTPKCSELWRPEYQRPNSSTQYATECVIDDLEVGAYYEIQVVETFYRNNNSDPATTYTSTFVNGPTNIDVDVTWQEIGSEALVTWDMPSDRTSIYRHGATLFNENNRYVASCYRNVSQTGRCTFDGLIDGQYRVETYVYANYGSSPQPLTASFSVNRPVPDDAALDPEYNWWSTIDGQMHVTISWNHVDAASSSSYTATVQGVSCSARATSTPERLNCDIKTDTDNMSFPVQARIVGGNVDKTINLPAPPVRPKNPTSPSASQISQTSAVISWDHDSSSNATIYAVWMNTHPGSCTVSAPFSGRTSCRLDGLEPGTTYQANVYADSEIGRRSKRTARVSFTTDAPPPPPPPPVLPPTCEEAPNDPDCIKGGGGPLVPCSEDPKCDPCEQDPTADECEVSCEDDPDQDKCIKDPCDIGERLHKKRARAINKANKQYTKKVDAAIEKLEDRPKKLAKKIKQLQKQRDRKITKAKKAYADRCLT